MRLFKTSKTWRKLDTNVFAARNESCRVIRRKRVPDSSSVSVLQSVVQATLRRDARLQVYLQEGVEQRTSRPYQTTASKCALNGRCWRRKESTLGKLRFRTSVSVLGSLQQQQVFSD